MFLRIYAIPDSKVHGANMGPIWGRQDPGGPHVGPMNLAIWDVADAYVFAFTLKHVLNERHCYHPSSNTYEHCMDS